MDTKSLEFFYLRDTPIIYTGLGNEQYLEDRGIKNVVDMDWWEETTRETSHKDAKITYLPAQHFSARGLTDRNKTLW
jgi:L-ascorbate metabolism protein UlaG (beta-lactamase superfamily)